MSLILSGFIIALLAFAAFCFYAGISSIGEKIKKDGLLSAIEVAVVVFLIAAVVVIAVGKVNKMLLSPSEDYPVVRA